MRNPPAITWRQAVRTVQPLPVMAAGGLLLALVTVLWVIQDSGICPPTDSEHHLFNALLYGRTFRLGGISGVWDLVRSAYVGWPPGSYLLLYGPMSWLFGEHPHQLRLASLALIPLLLWGSYLLGREFLDRRSATLGALLTIFTFGISGQLRQVSIDLPSTVAVLFTTVVLLRSRRFSRPRLTLLYGAACGLCFFCRVQSLFFLFAPAALMAGLSLTRAPSWRARGRQAGWLLAGLALVALVSSPWWYGKLTWLYRISTSHMDPSQVTPRGNPGFGPGLWFYSAALGRLVGWPLLLALVGLLPHALRRRDDRPEVLVLLLVVLGGLLGCVVGVHREARYMLPAMPALVVLALVGLNAVGPRMVSVVGALLLLLTVGPTLLIAGFPVEANHPVVRTGVTEWAYVRQQFVTPTRRAAEELNKVLLREEGGDSSGKNAYVLYLQARNVNFLPRVGAAMVPLVPRLVYSFSHNINIVNNPWHLRQRQRRTMYIISETQEMVGLPLVWTIPAKKYNNKTPIRLHRVPATHRWKSGIDRFDLYRLNRSIPKGLKIRRVKKRPKRIPAKRLNLKKKKKGKR